MAASINYGVLLNIIHDHPLRNITYEDNIERTMETDRLPDPFADSWSAGGMTVYNVNVVGDDWKTYSYGALGTFNSHNGYSTFYLSSNAQGTPTVMVDAYNQTTGTTTTTTAHTLPATLISCEIALTGLGNLTRNTFDPDTFNMAGQANKHLRWTYYFNNDVVVDHINLGASYGGSFRIDPDTEVEGTKLGDTEEGGIIVES